MQSLSGMKTRVGALLAPAHDRVVPRKRVRRPARPPRTRRYEPCLGCTFDGRCARSVRQRHSSGEDTSGRHLHFGSWSANACASVNTWPQRTHSTVTARSVRAQRLSCRRRSARLAHLVVERGRAGDDVEAVCGRLHDPGHTSARGSFGGSSPGSGGNARREAASGRCLESFSWRLAHPLRRRPGRDRPPPAGMACRDGGVGLRCCIRYRGSENAIASTAHRDHRVRLRLHVASSDARPDEA